ncbi:MAG: hypothetical protein AAF915_10815 [Cyanobacteria bacterium P01_D01_bin.50]
MEQWQFLIQKEGERTWHPLDKPRVEVTEGRYRVVARSNRINTDVEVRVTHSSPNEIPPRRRIQKRRRRSNSEGLTAIIPFTYLKSGIWELQCSGDLMSDLLGASWQFTVSLEVITSRHEEKTVLKTSSSQNLDKQYQINPKKIETNQAKPNIKNVQSRVYSSSSKDLKTNDTQLISSTSLESAKKKIRNTTAGKLISPPPKSGLKTNLHKVVSEKPAQKLRESLQAKKTDRKKNVNKKPVKKSTQKLLIAEHQDAREKHTQKQQNSVKATPEKAASRTLEQQPPEKSISIENKAASEKPTQKSLEKSRAIENKAASEKPTQKENFSIIEQAASPVRVKGDTAEQILQNLMELALPSSESLLPNETVEDTPIASPPLPLLLTLDKVNYIAGWGESITLNALVQFKEKTNEHIKQIFGTEIQIELRSPQNSELLQSVRQLNSNGSLPFAIDQSIDIPCCCSSKLILGEIKVYGAVSGNGVIELLASQSFIITAQITELLAITEENPRGELDSFAYTTGELSARDNATQIIDTTASVDLELFNLVKTAKPQQPVIGVPSTKKSLPPRIDPRRLHRRVTTHSPKLPNVPGYQEKIDEYINNGHIETLKYSTLTGTSFPYLRKVKALPSSNVEDEVDVYEVEESTYVSVADNQSTVKKSAASENTSQAELVVDREKDDNYFELEEPVTLRSSEFIATKSINTSPLIKKWMLSQGHSLAEPIDVEYEDYNIGANNQEIPHQQITPTPNIETDDNLQTLDWEKLQDVPTRVSSNRNIQATPSPYFSISTSSEWKINQRTAPSTQIAQEIVVDDTDIVADNILETENSEQDKLIDDKINNSPTVELAISNQEMEQLPTPQLYISQGELLAGKSINVRVRLPQGNSHLAVKLWLEDCQTRNLLYTSHLLTNLTPNNNGELEVTTKLDIPFGCLEIRLEAIAINTSSLIESHKFTIQRTVIPPDLPNIQLDAILGM